MSPSRLFVCACLAVVAFAIVAKAGTACAAQTSASPASPSVSSAGTLALVVDVQRVLRESLAAKDAQKHLDTQRAKFQAETEGEENELRRAEQDLAKSRDQLDAKTYGTREKQLRQRFLTVERHVEARRKALDATFTASMNSVRNALVDVVEDVAKFRGARVVIAKQQILWMDQGLDATDEVLAKLNAKLASVPMNLDAPANVLPDTLPLQNRAPPPSLPKAP
ncbi:MAG: OmpH family outer membrane protein [Bdellovibrionales bacterium]